MIAAQQVHLAGVLGLQREQVRDALRLVLASIDVVAQEEHLRARTAEFLPSKHLDQVVELPMDIAYEQDFALDSQQIRFFAQYVRSLPYYGKKCLLREQPTRILVVLDELCVGHQTSALAIAA